jgi:hypothetical protein
MTRSEGTLLCSGNFEQKDAVSCGSRTIIYRSVKGEEKKRKGFTIIFVRNKEMKGKGRTTYTK